MWVGLLTMVNVSAVFAPPDQAHVTCAASPPTPHGSLQKRGFCLPISDNSRNPFPHHGENSSSTQPTRSQTSTEDGNYLEVRRLTRAVNVQDFYSVLGVSSRATLGEIKARFRFLSHAYHPDKFGTDGHRRIAEEEFKRINNAYQILSDPRQRAQFDRSRQTSPPPEYQQSAPPPTPPPRREPPPQPPPQPTTASTPTPAESRGSHWPAFFVVFAIIFFIFWLRPNTRNTSTYTPQPTPRFSEISPDTRLPATASGAVTVPTTTYSQGHVFSVNGYCVRCGWERDFVQRTNRKCVPSPTPVQQANATLPAGHVFNANGYCTRCGWERDFVTRTHRQCVQ